MDDLQKRSWAEISLENIRHNYNAIRASLPEGCRFRPRCPHACDRCAQGAPLIEIEPGHQVKCVLCEKEA